MSTVVTDYWNQGIPSGVGQVSDAVHPTANIPTPSADDPLRDLLQAIAEVLDVRDVFPRVSEICARLLPHDSMELVVHDAAGGVALRAQSADDLPNAHHATVAGTDGFSILQDFVDLRHGGGERRAWVEHAVGSGYRSCLSVGSRCGEQMIQLTFFSKQPEVYTADHVPMARHVAAFMAIAVSHQQLAETARKRMEVRVRAEAIENRVRSLDATVERTRVGGHVVGESPAWRDALKRATQVAVTETTVFLEGESGTGKEVLARFIHRASPRRNGPFVAINCAALPEQLLESELFGYERGAFTGAQQAKPGQIELASMGVLFLDEVSEMNPTSQAKLLRFLQEREFQRLGGTRLLKANVRVIAASNRDLRQAVAEGKFREDLYYRLHVFHIPLPPLRERSSDIPLLAEAFLAEFGRSLGRRSRLTLAATQKLLVHSWPGNVRELQNALERATILCEGGLIEPIHLSLHHDVRVHTGTDLGALEREKIQQVLQETDGNKAKAARRLGITRTQLYVRLRKHALDGLPPLRLCEAG